MTEIYTKHISARHDHIIYGFAVTAFWAD